MAALSEPEPEAFGEVVEALEVIVQRCEPLSPAAERAACILACAIVRDRRRPAPKG